VLKNCSSRRDPALCGYCKCSHIDAYAALSKTPHVLADVLMLVFQHPVQTETAAGLSGPAAVSENTKAAGRFDPPSAFLALTGVFALSAPQADRYDSHTGNKRNTCL
jgi:hypothetical protein